MAPKQLAVAEKGPLKEFIASIATESFDPAVQCYICSAKCTTVHGLMCHLRKHKATASDLEPLKKYRNIEDQASRAVPKIQNEDLEFKIFRPDPHGDVTHIHCMCGKPINKMSVKYHLTKSTQHKESPIPMTEIAAFKSYQDGRAQEKPGVDKQAHNLFEVAYKNKFSSLPLAPPFQEARSISEAIEIVKEIAKPIAAFGEALLNKGTSGSTSCSTTNLSFPFTGKLRSEAKHFKMPPQEELDQDDKRRRFKWPKGCRCALKLKAIERFTRKRVKKSPSDGSFKKIMQGIRYVFGLFKFSDNTITPEAAFKYIFHKGLLTKAFDLDICNPNLYWTRKIRDSLVMLQKYLKIKFVQNDDEIGLRFTEQLGLIIIDELKPQLATAAEEQIERRIKIDRRRAKLLAPVGVRLKGIKKAKHDIKVLCNENFRMFQKSSTLRRGVRFCLNSAMYGSHGELSYPGRSGELENLPLSTMTNTLADDRSWWFTVSDHKTKRTSGDLGRIVPKDLRDEWKMFCKFSCTKRDQLFVPPRESTKVVQVGKLAKAYGKVYTPGYEYPEVTLRRKFVETDCARPTNQSKTRRMAKKLMKFKLVNKAISMMAKCAAHGSKMARKHYILESGNPLEMAHTAKAYVEEFVGGVPAVTPDEQEEFNKRTTDVILQEFFGTLDEAALELAENELDPIIKSQDAEDNDDDSNDYDEEENGEEEDGDHDSCVSDDSDKCDAILKETIPIHGHLSQTHEGEEHHANHRSPIKKRRVEVDVERCDFIEKGFHPDSNGVSTLDDEEDNARIAAIAAVEKYKVQDSAVGLKSSSSIDMPPIAIIMSNTETIVDGTNISADETSQLSALPQDTGMDSETAVGNAMHSAPVPFPTFKPGASAKPKTKKQRPSRACSIFPRFKKVRVYFNEVQEQWLHAQVLQTFGKMDVTKAGAREIWKDGLALKILKKENEFPGVYNKIQKLGKSIQGDSSLLEESTEDVE